jgi:acetylornithine deacetylase/succinyl-diaminopimelate desuccinylase-like protein
MPFEEAAIGRLVAAEMATLGLDEVWIDPIGNACGRLYGRDRSLPALVLNTHLDHVDPGDPALWPVPPYAGAIVGDRLIGRGAADIKGPLAVQIYSLAALLRQGQRPRRDVVFTGVVQEEIGGAGAAYWAEHLDYPVELVLLGEPSSNNLSLGHRGILSLWLTFPGRSVHASVPEKGVNPNYALATFLQRLQAAQSQLSAHPVLGQTTVAPTLVEVDTKSPNVTPAWSRVLLDFRTASESTTSIKAFIRRVAGDLNYELRHGWEPDNPVVDDDEIITGFVTDPQSEVVRRVGSLLAAGMGRPAELTSYRFATDGRHFVPYGLAILGYSPADEEQAHIAGESISIASMAESLRGHVALLLDL